MISGKFDPAQPRPGQAQWERFHVARHGASVNNAKVDEEFFSPAGTAALGLAHGRLKSNFLRDLSYGDVACAKPVHPQPDFDEACRVL